MWKLQESFCCLTHLSFLDGSNFWIPCLDQHARSCVLRNEAGAARDLTTMKIGYKIHLCF